MYKYYIRIYTLASLQRMKNRHSILKTFNISISVQFSIQGNFSFTSSPKPPIISTEPLAVNLHPAFVPCALHCWLHNSCFLF